MKNEAQSAYLFPGNGGPWRCGSCKFVNFDLKIICLKCNKGVRPPFQPQFPWICLNAECGYTINDTDRSTCFRCGCEKWKPTV